MKNLMIVLLLLTFSHSLLAKETAQKIVTVATFDNPNPSLPNAKAKQDRCYCDIMSSPNNGCSGATSKESCIRNSSGSSTGCKWSCVYFSTGGGASN